MLVLAERARFELARPLRAFQFSRLVHSTTLAPLQIYFTSFKFVVLRNGARVFAALAVLADKSKAVCFYPTLAPLQKLI